MKIIINLENMKTESIVFFKLLLKKLQIKYNTDNLCIECEKKKKVDIMDEVENEIFHSDYCRDCNMRKLEILTLDNPVYKKDFI